MLNAQGEQIGRTIYEQSSADPTLQGLSECLSVLETAMRVEPEYLPAALVQSVKSIAPHSDRAAQLEIVATKDPSSEQLAAWEGRLQEYPTAWRALATQYPAHDDRSSAIRCYERSVALMPTASAVTLLANLHLQEGDADAWEQTLVKSLDVFDLAWDREQVYAELMRGFAERGQWRQSDSARPGIRPERNIPWPDGRQHGVRRCCPVGGVGTVGASAVGEPPCGLCVVLVLLVRTDRARRRRNGSQAGPPSHHVRRRPDE